MTAHGAGGSNEDELTQRELLLAEAERIVHLGSWMWNTETGAIRWSDEMYRILGYEPGSVDPSVEGFFGLIHPEDRARVEEVAARGVASHAPEPVDFRLLRRDGMVRHVHMEGAAVQQDGPLRIVGTVLDVTERLELEAELRRSARVEAIGTVAGGLAHDFNNYLQVILGHARVTASNPSIDARASASLDQIAAAAGRCQRLARDLLSFARRTTLARERVDLCALVEHAVPLMQALVGPDIAVVHEACGEALDVEGDEAALEQALLNLAANARDAISTKGTLTLSTRLIEDAQAGAGSAPSKWVGLTVRDDGCGMSPSVAERIFEPYFSTKASGQGTGLGLASVLSLVEQTGGTIEVESQLGLGTTFLIRLPFAPPTNGASVPDSRGHILVVEDQDAIRGLVRDALDLAGYTVVEARDGLEALDRLAGAPYIELVISDISMPRMTGIELLEAVAEQDTGPAFLMMTGVPDPQLDKTDTPTLRKPFSETELLQAVQERITRVRALR